MRTFDVLVRREVYEWERVDAEDVTAARAVIQSRSRREPGRTTRVFADRVYPIEPITKYGRVLVTRATDTCGPDRKKLLYLDCGHLCYVDPALWFPENPWVECATCQGQAAPMKAAA